MRNNITKRMVRLSFLFIFAAANILGLEGRGLALEEQETKSSLEEPIIPLKVEAGKLPLLEKSLADPAVLKMATENDIPPAELIKKIYALKEKLYNTSDDDEKLEQTRSIFNMLLMASSYLNETSIFKGKAKRSSAAQLTTDISAINNMLSVYSTQLMQLSSNEEEKDRAKYHKNVAAYFLEDFAQVSKQELDEIARSTHAGPELKSGAQLLQLVMKLKNENPDKALSLGSDVINSLTTEGKIVAHLMIAQSENQSTGKGDRSSLSLDAVHLREALRLAAQLPEKVGGEILEYAVAVWRINKNPAEGWESNPFSAMPVKNPLVMAAIKERAALAQLKKEHYSQAQRLYKTIALQLEGNPWRIALDRRIIQIQEEQYKKTKNVKQLWDSLYAYEKEYSNPALFGKNYAAQTQNSYRFYQKKRALVENIILNRTESDATEIRRYLLDFLIKDLQSIRDEEGRKKMRLKIARYQSANKNYLAAREEYNQLLKTAKTNEERMQYLVPAIKNQTVLAGWTLTPPWDDKQISEANDKQEELFALYDKASKACSETLKWRMYAHMGLLALHQGKEARAIKLWTENLNDPIPNRNKNLALGKLLSLYAQTQRPSEFIELMDLSNKLKIKPLFMKNPLNVTQLYTDYLYLAAQKNLRLKKTSVGLTLLQKFIAASPAGKRKEESYILLVNEQLKAGQLTAAFKSIAEYDAVFRQPEKSRALMMRGIALAKVKDPELAIKYCILLLKQETKGAIAAEARETLAGLYYKKGWYGEASKLYKLQSIATDVSRAKAVEAALAYMNIENRYGDKENAVAGARQVMLLSKNDPVAFSQAAAYAAIFYEKNGHLSELAQVSNALKQIRSTQPAVRRSQALVQNLMAKHSSELHVKTATASGQDVKGSIDKIYLSFVKQAQTSNAKCRQNRSWCARAQAELQQAAKLSLDQLQRLSAAGGQIPPSLSGYKTQITNMIKKQAYSK
jgi:hypothetical protein